MSYDQLDLDINGVHTAVLTAGAGEPLVFLHGELTAAGFDALLPLAENHRLIVPLHPGFGASADDPSIDEVHDYRRHYLDLLDRLGVDRMTLAGHSMGGYLAAAFAVDHAERISRLVLAAPLGLKVPGIPNTDLFSVVPAELPGYLTENQAIFEAEAAGPATPEFLADQYRETTSAARLLWESPYDRKLGKWLHRVSMPTLLLWGEADRMVPAAQSPHWAALLPDAEQRTLPGVGHLLFDESPAAAEAVLQFTGRRVLA